MRRVSIIIPTYGEKGLKLVVQCVKSIERWAKYSLAEIIVVDDGSKIKNYLDRLEVEFPDARMFSKRVLIKKKNTGFADTCNVGIESAGDTTDIILLNNDIVAENDFITLMAKFADRDDKIGIIGPKLIYPDGLGIQSAGSFLPKSSNWFDHIYRGAPIGSPDVNVNRKCVCVTGACMYIKREVIEKIGLLDDIFPMCFEDVDYCLRAKEVGFKTVYYYEPVLTHFENMTKQDRGFWLQESCKMFWNRWKVIKNDGKPVGELIIERRKNEKSTAG